MEVPHASQQGLHRKAHGFRYLYRLVIPIASPALVNFYGGFGQAQGVGNLNLGHPQVLATVSKGLWGHGISLRLSGGGGRVQLPPPIRLELDPHVNEDATPADHDPDIHLSFTSFRLPGRYNRPGDFIYSLEIRLSQAQKSSR